MKAFLSIDSLLLSCYGSPPSTRDSTLHSSSSLSHYHHLLLLPRIHADFCLSTLLIPAFEATMRLQLLLWWLLHPIACTLSFLFFHDGLCSFPVSATFRLQEGELFCGASSDFRTIMHFGTSACDNGVIYTTVQDGGHILEIWVYSTSTHRIPGVLAGPNLFAVTQNSVANLTVMISRRSSCNGGRRFICDNPSNCDLIVNGSGRVLPSTLTVVQDGSILSLVVFLQAKHSSENLKLALANGLCASRTLEQTNSRAIATIHFDDSRAAAVNLWVAIPKVPVWVNNVSRTGQFTNTQCQLIVYLDFTETVRNTSKELLSGFKASHGNLMPIYRKKHRNQHFAFQLTNLETVDVVTLSFDSRQIITKTGAVVRQPGSIYFLYDAVRPEVTLTPITINKTGGLLVRIIFTKPVFSFGTEAINVSTGQITSFQEVSKRMYMLNILADEGMMIKIVVPENQTADIAGNLNMASNAIYVKHYAIPTVSIAMYSLITISLLATTTAAGMLSIASLWLSAANILTTATMEFAICDPSRNLLGMIGHVQVFALTQWMVTSLPMEYYETVRGLQWLIPHGSLPWENKCFPFSSRLLIFGCEHDWHCRQLVTSTCNHVVGLNEAFVVQSQMWHQLDANSSLFGPPLSASDYELYFKTQSSEYASSGNILGLRTTTTGWHEFLSNIFWLGVIGGVLVSIHLSILGLVAWRIGNASHGALLLPRFELFLLILALPGLCQSIAFLIEGHTITETIAGLTLLAIPAGFLLSAILFIGFSVCFGDLVQYNEIKWKPDMGAWYKTTGTWTCREGLPSTFLIRFGLFFTDRKGPPKFVTIKGDAQNDSLLQTDSGCNGIGRMRVSVSDNEKEEEMITIRQKLMGIGKANYVVIDWTRRILLGIVFGLYDAPDLIIVQTSIAFGITAAQLSYLAVFRPYINTGVHIVETVSLLCESIMFAICLNHPNMDNHQGLGKILLALLSISVTIQLINEWCALSNQLLGLSSSEEHSLKFSLKMFGIGSIIPFLPKEKWLSLVPQPRVGLVTVVQAHAEEESESECNHALEDLSEPETLNHESQSAVNEIAEESADNIINSSGSVANSEIQILRELARASFVQDGNPFSERSPM